MPFIIKFTVSSNLKTKIEVPVGLQFHDRQDSMTQLRSDRSEIGSMISIRTFNNEGKSFSICSICEYLAIKINKCFLFKVADKVAREAQPNLVKLCYPGISPSVELLPNAVPTLELDTFLPGATVHV